MTEEDLRINFGKLKNLKWSYILLGVFLLLGLYLRIYHLSFPAIGYHNMKENEYLDEAYLFYTEGNYLHKQAFAFYGLDEGTGYHEEYAQAPIVPYLTVFFWKIFGQHIWIPRLLIIAFMLGSILLTYYVVKRLTKNEYISLVSSFLITIMPLGIYFGRNVQPEAPGLFFILLSALFFLKWLDTKDRKNLLFMGFSLSVAWELKYTFAIIIIPLLFIFPYKEMYEKFRKKSKEFYNDISYAFLGILPGIIATLVYELTVVDPWKRGYEIDILRMFESGFWTQRIPSIMSFLNDNYTWWFVWFAIFGLVFVLINRKSIFSKFMIGYTIAIIPYIDLISSKIAGHSYYQMPFLPLICILSAYFLYTIGSLLKQFLKIKHLIYLPLILILVAIPSMQAANDRVWGTIFYGQDEVGKYIESNTQPDTRIFAFTHSQGLAVCSYAHRRCGATYNLTEFKHKEEAFNITYLYVDPSYIEKVFEQSGELSRYIKQNYRLDMISAVKVGDKLAPLQLVLKRPGKLNLSEINSAQPQFIKAYNTKIGNVELYFIKNTK